MDEILNELNYDFNFQIHLFNQAVDNLNTHDKSLAIAWVHKLSMSASSVQEAQLRNDFLYYLVKMCGTGVLNPPFKEKPPKGRLINMMGLLPPEARTAKGAGAEKKDKKGVRKAELFERSPDKGAFLAAQPVPRCGAFCYLAVISKTPPE